MSAPPPPQPELDEMFEDLLDQLMMIDEKVRQGMRKQPAERKWQMILQQGQVKKVDPSSFVEGLRLGGDPAIEKVTSLAGLLKSCDRTFLEDFVEQDGVKQLFTVQMYWDAQRKAENCKPFVQCCRGIMNNAAGLNAVMATPFAVRCLASYLAPRQAHVAGVDDEQRGHILQLLAAVSSLNPKAYALVLDALDNIRLAHGQPSRFTCIVAILQGAGTSSEELQASAMIFVNTLTLSPDELLTRVWVRTEFIQQGLIGEVEKLERIQSKNDAVATQLEAFRHGQAEDAQEQAVVTDKTAAGENLEEIWELLNKYVCNEQSEVRPYFINMLQSLLMIPHADPELSARMWKFAATATIKTLELGEVDRAAAEQYFRDLMAAFGGEQLLVVAAQKHEEGGAGADNADLVAVIEKLNLNPAAKRADEFAMLTERAESLRAAAAAATKPEPVDTTAVPVETAHPPLDAHIATLSQGYDAQIQYLKEQIEFQRAGSTGNAPGPAPPAPPRLVDSVTIAAAPASSQPQPPPPTPSQTTAAPPPVPGAPAPPGLPATPGGPPARAPPAPPAGGPPPPPGGPRGGPPPPPPPPGGRGPVRTVV
jgi:hypothetical protein